MYTCMYTALAVQVYIFMYTANTQGVYVYPQSLSRRVRLRVVCIMYLCQRAVSVWASTVEERGGGGNILSYTRVQMHTVFVYMYMYLCTRTCTQYICVDVHVRS